MATKAIARRTRTVYVKRVGHRAKHMTIPLAVVAGVAPTLAFAYQGFMLPGGEGGPVEAAHRITMRMTGYEWKNGNFSWSQLAQGWGPLLLGAMAHKAANRFGLNRAIAKAGIPLLRI